MIKLYPAFEHWSKGGNIWICSDPHFDDADMQWRGVTSEQLVKSINNKVGKKDTLIILGDIGNVNWVKKLRGYKVLVMGNHDSGASNYKRIKESKVVEDVCPYCGKEVVYNYLTLANCGYGCAWCHNCCDIVKPREKIIKHEVDNQLFDEVYEGPVFISDKILLSHEPIDFPYALNIHGHQHSAEARNDENHINVCVEKIDFTPVSLLTLVKNGALSNIESIHRVTIDEASKRKKKVMSGKYK